MKDYHYTDPERYGVFYSQDERFVKSKAESAANLMYYKKTEVPYLWYKILPKFGLACVAGESDCGKSAFLRQLALAVCTMKSNEAFLGSGILSSCRRALYVSTEDNRLAIGAMLNKQCQELQIKQEQLNNLYFLCETENVIDEIRIFLERNSTDLVIIDTLEDIIPSYAKSTAEVRHFLNKLQNIAEKYRCLVVVSHHTNRKAVNKRPSKYNLIGSPAIEAKARTVIELRNDPFDRTIKHLCIVKGNYMPEKYKQKSFMLQFSQQLVFKFMMRVADFDTLTVKPDPNDDNERVEKYLKLRKEGLRGDELAKEMGFASRGSLSVWAKNHIKNPSNSPSNQSEPFDPKDFSEPTNTAEPDPADQNDQTSLSEPTVPSAPSELSDSSDPSELSDQSDSSAPSELPDQSAPTDLPEPTDPSDPSEPSLPITPSHVPGRDTSQ